MDRKWDIINQYKNMINVKYWGIQCRITNLINEERQHKQLGGDLKKITIDNNDIKYNIVYNNNPNDLNIQLLTIDGSLQCGIILFDKDNKTEAIFQDVHAYDNCYQSTVENTSHGKMIVKLMIEICKKKNIKKILLSDNSIKKIDKYILDMKIYYTMINGYPWYVQFGFKNVSDNEILKENYLILKGNKVKDFKENVFINKRFIELSKENLDMSIKKFIKLLSHYDINIFTDVYKKMYDKLKLKEIKNNQYYLEI